MDWTAIIAELTGPLGLSQPAIAAACNCGQSTISELARGATKDPRFSTGEALRALLATKRAEAAKKAEAGADPVPGALAGDQAPTAQQRPHFEERPATAT